MTVDKGQIARLFDECGVSFTSDRTSLLDAIAAAVTAAKLELYVLRTAEQVLFAVPGPDGFDRQFVERVYERLVLDSLDDDAPLPDGGTHGGQLPALIASPDG